MTNAKNWKDFYEEYKTAASKPSIFGPKYKGYWEKIKSLREKANALWDNAFSDLSNDYVLFKGTNFYFRHIDTRFGDRLPYDDVLQYLVAGNIEKAKDGMSRKMVKELGAAIMNFSDSLMDVRKGCLGIEMALAKVDDKLCEKIRGIVAESDKYYERANKMTKAKENRQDAPRSLWAQVVVSYAYEELFVVGAEVYGYGKVTKVTESMLFFDTGIRKKKDSISLEWIFVHDHPECPKIGR